MSACDAASGYSHTPMSLSIGCYFFSLLLPNEQQFHSLTIDKEYAHDQKRHQFE
jgi:hypothetical protein